MLGIIPSGINILAQRGQFLLMLVADGEQAKGFGGEMLRVQILSTADSLIDELFLVRCQGDGHGAEFGTFRSGEQVPLSAFLGLMLENADTTRWAARSEMENKIEQRTRRVSLVRVSLADLPVPEKFR